MSIFNEEQIKAMFSREYICHEYLYPTREEVLGIANDDSEEDSDD